MKHIYILIIFLFSLTCFSQNTATFETESLGSTSFTDNGQVFNITTQTTAQTFAVFNYTGKGWNGTVADNQFIDNSGFANYEPVQFTVSNAGQKSFRLKSLYLFLSQTNLDPGTGNCTIVGKLKGATMFTAVAGTNFNSNVANNGFTLINLATYGGSDNSNIFIDEYVVSTTGSFEYVALDAMKWEDICSGLTVTPSQTNVSCNGGSNGSATANASGGAGEYSYSWAPSGGSAATATGLAAGTYTVTVTDANGCTATQSFTITQPAAALAVTPSAQTNISCFGGSNGSASVNTPTGGTPGYTYSWAPSGGTAATATGLAVGTYTVTVTDANGCTATQSFTITQPAAALAVTRSAQTNISCFGGSNGSASVNTPTGGTPGYTYSWAPSGGTAATATGLAVGTYTVTVTDANGCTATQSFTITQPAAALAVTRSAQTNISCFGGSNGSASVNKPTGGTPGYTYSWAPSGGTAATATGLAVGTYTVTVTDANGCTATQSFTITQPAAALAVTPSAQTNISCFGGSNGSASVNTPTGGTPGYTYSWAPSGGTAATATGLAAGTYTVTVTDANGCTATQSFTITQPAAALAVTPSAQTNISCFGGSNGSASINTPTGGTPGYTYSWAHSGGTAATATGLAAGTYTVTVTDANGCTATQSFTITQPAAALAVTPSAQTNISCFGGSNGSASVNTPTGGTPGYTYDWAPSGGTAATASGLTAGTYTVTVTDANSCTSTQSFTITEPTILIASAAAQTNVSCNSGSNGSATVSATGGTGSYTYSWAPSGGTAATASGLTAGTYTVTVTDANSCTSTQSFTITEPTILIASAAAQTNVSCNSGSNGSATVSATGGTGSYTYSWAPSGGTAATASGLTVGTYTVTVTDANSCTATQSFTITEPTAISFTTTSLPKYNYNLPYTQSVVATGGTGTKTFSVTAGNLPQGFSLSSAGVISGTSTQVADSNFTITITDANSCTVSQNFDLKLSQIPITVTATVSQSKVYGDNDPVLTYTVTPSLLPGDTFSGNLTRVAGENIGNYAINLGTLSAGNNYLMTFVSKDFAITAKPITVTAAAKSKTFGDADPALTYTFSPALQTGDTFTGSLTRQTGENIGTYAINQGTLALSNNYSLTYVGADLTIGAKTITVTAVAKSKTYGTADPVLTYTFAPVLVTADNFTGSLTRQPGENVGIYAINQGTLALSNNYSLTYVGANLTIGSKTITVTAAAKSKTYGDADPALTYTFAPALVTGDNFTGSLTRLLGENVGTYAINQGTLALNANYTLTYVGANLTIGKKTITVTAAAKSKTYGEADPALTYTFAPALVTGDSFSGSLSRTAGQNVGMYEINQGTLALNANYTLTYVGSNFSITAKPITVTANASQSKVYGTADPVYTYSFSPALVSGDSFTGALTRAAGNDAGTYQITQGTLSAGTNYTLTYIGNNFTIVKANQTITWNQTLGFGCEGESTVVLTATSNSGLPVSYTSSNSNLVSISGNSLNLLNYGSVTISASQLGNNNYNPAVVVTIPLINSQPNLIRKQFENIIFFDNSSKSFNTYTWYKNGVLVAGQTDQYFKENGPLNGTYYAVATKLNGIVVTTCPLVLSPTVEEEYIKIVPNPVKPNGTYELLTNVSSSRLQNARVEVYSVGGLLMENKTTSQNTVSLKAPMVEGIYIVKMTLANGKYFTKNVLVKN